MEIKKIQNILETYLEIEIKLSKMSADNFDFQNFQTQLIDRCAQDIMKLLKG